MSARCPKAKQGKERTEKDMMQRTVKSEQDQPLHQASKMKDHFRYNSTVSFSRCLMLATSGKTQNNMLQTILPSSVHPPDIGRSTVFVRSTRVGLRVVRQIESRKRTVGQRQNRRGVQNEWFKFREVFLSSKAPLFVPHEVLMESYYGITNYNCFFFCAI